MSNEIDMSNLKNKMFYYWLTSFFDYYKKTLAPVTDHINEFLNEWTDPGIKKSTETLDEDSDVRFLLDINDTIYRLCYLYYHCLPTDSICQRDWPYLTTKLEGTMDELRSFSGKEV